MVPTLRSSIVVAAVVLTVVLSGCVGTDATNTTATASDQTPVSTEQPPATADPTTADETTENDTVAERFERRLSSLDSYSARMVTETTLDGNTTTTVTDVWARPATGEVRREVVSSPHTNGTVTVLNESMIAVYNPDTDSVTRINQTGQTPSGNTITGPLLNDTSVETAGTDRIDGEQTYRVRLEPESAMSGSGTITAWLDDETYFPVRIEYEGAGAANISSVIEYENVELNPELSDSRFRLDVPAGTNTTTYEPPETREFESLSALRSNVSATVPTPEVPAGFSLERATVVDGETRSISLTYRNDTSRISVSQRNRTFSDGTGADNTTRAGETVQVGDRTGRLQSLGETRFVTWSCDGRQYSVSGDLSRDAVLDVAASVACT